MKEKKREINKLKKGDRLFISLFLAYPLLLFCVFYIGVNFNSILLSFKTIDFTGHVTGWTFSNFGEFIKNITGSSAKYSAAIINSLKMYFICLFVCLPLYIVLSYILFKKCFLHKTLRALVMVPQIISGFIMCLIFKRFIDSAIPEMMMKFFGKENFPNLLYDTNYAFGTTLFYTIWISFSTSLIVYPNAMNEIDESILEAAKLDGVGNMFAELRYIIIPLIFPTIETFLITGFAGMMANAYVTPTFYFTDPPLSTINVGYIYWSEVLTAGESMYPILAAGGLILTVIFAPLTFALKWGLNKLSPTVDV